MELSVTIGAAGADMPACGGCGVGPTGAEVSPSRHAPSERVSSAVKRVVMERVTRMSSSQ